MLKATGLSVRLGRRQVLHAVDFRADPGEITAIVGPNGSGKTTLLRALTGELAVSGVTLNGRDVFRTPPARLAGMRGVLPQFTPLSFPFTVAEVVRIGLTSGPFGGYPDLIGQALAAVGLDGFANRLHHDLSGGEQQRVHLARVLAQVWQPVGPDGPRWLFLDEPVASLDIAHQLQVMEVARRYAQAGGGVVAVMHDLNLTAMHAARVCVMAEGRAVATGPVAEVFRDDLLSRVYGCPMRLGTAPSDGLYFLPQASAAG